MLLNLQCETSEPESQIDLNRHMDQFLTALVSSIEKYSTFKVIEWYTKTAVVRPRAEKTIKKIFPDNRGRNTNSYLEIRF